MTSFDPNNAAIETWTEETDGFDRVEAVVSRAGKPQSAAEIAEAAHVSESTARKHLDRLAGLGLALATQDGRVTRYERDDDHYLLERVRHLQRSQTREDLLESIETMQTEIESYRHEYGVEAPEDLALGEASAEGPADPWGALTDWSTTREHLAIARTALAYKRASVLANA